MTRLTWNALPVGRLAVTTKLPFVPSTLSARVCLYTPCCTNVIAKVVGSVLTNVQETVLEPDDGHSAPSLGLVTVMAMDAAASERSARK